MKILIFAHLLLVSSILYTMHESFEIKIESRIGMIHKQFEELDNEICTRLQYIRANLNQLKMEIQWAHHIPAERIAQYHEYIQTLEMFKDQFISLKTQEEIDDGAASSLAAASFAMSADNTVNYSPPPCTMPHSHSLSDLATVCLATEQPLPQRAWLNLFPPPQISAPQRFEIQTSLPLRAPQIHPLNIRPRSCPPSDEDKV